MIRSLTREVGAALVEGLSVVVGGLVDAQTQVTQGAPVGGAQWSAQVLFEGAISGTCTVAFDAAGASALTARIMGLEGEVPPEAVIDTCRELCSQAIGTLSLDPVARGASLKLGTLTATAELDPGNDGAVYAIGADKLAAPVTVTVWGELEAAPGAPQPELAVPAKQAPPRPAAQALEAVPATDGLRAPAERIDVILDIELPLTVRFGRTELSLKTLTRIAPGALIDLGRSADDPVEILVSNRVVARGEVVIVSGNYGIRILDVISPRDRTRSLEV